MHVIYERNLNKVVQVNEDLPTALENFKLINQAVTVAELRFLMETILTVEQLKELYENHSGCLWFGALEGTDLLDACYNMFQVTYPDIPTMRKLIYHPESECLFTVFDEESLRGALSGGECHDVTGHSRFEMQYLEQEKAIAKAKLPLRQKLHTHLIIRSQVPSCINCLYWTGEQETCTLYGSIRPPAKVIVESCGQGWEPDIPF